MEQVFENIDFIFYTNEMTEILEKDCVRYFKGLPPLNDCKVYIVEDKESQEREYVLYEKGKPVFASPQFDAIGAHIEIDRFFRSSKK